MGKNESKAGARVRAAETSGRPDGAAAARILNGYRAKTGVRAGNGLVGGAIGIKLPPLDPGCCAACGLVFTPDRLRDIAVNPAVDLAR